MNTSRFREWFDTRLQISDEIVQRHSRAGVEDADILLCCTASAFASQMWPGEGIDRARFVQYLVRFSAADLRLPYISVPVLQERLRDRAQIAKSNSLEDHFYPEAGLRLLSSSEADHPEDRILEQVPDLQLREVRLCSYASIVYSEFRSGLVHEYTLSNYLSSIPGMDVSEEPTYMNWLIEPEPEAIAELVEELSISEEEVKATHARNIRRLHIPYSFLRRVVSTASSSALSYWDGARSWRLHRPERWWLDGGPVQENNDAAQQLHAPQGTRDLREPNRPAPAKRV